MKAPTDGWVPLLGYGPDRRTTTDPWDVTSLQPASIPEPLVRHDMLIGTVRYIVPLHTGAFPIRMLTTFGGIQADIGQANRLQESGGLALPRESLFVALDGPRQKENVGALAAARGSSRTSVQYLS